ncbi:patatin-like phospholipase family protein [Myroides guanonis]|uniref:NTE family protein n=1 Tax=Myroides guanonis TaxID=1150112 RepID=A0A1I3MVQ5_9FLAO|nr:patatin-like phospholipase family protein [Myroides guanonis]SFJ01051.1 NTE family protein [Myroides guanonis]
MKRGIIILCFLLMGNILFAQTEKKPKIGLVLSGGGAKGLAHIGVLKVLEEEGIEIDYIAGTSMGAIIGGLYASGYTASELDSIFGSVDADALVRDYIPRISKSFYEKRNDEIYALTLPFERFRIGVPRAFSKGMYNYNLLSRLLAHVRYERDFNKLKIPFLCIATDMESGEMVVLRKGSLPQAILASGAFPSLYSPVEIDGKLLIDGGVVNNYPIAELREMGADIVIGVDVQDGLKKREDIQSAPDLLLQISNFSMYHNMEEKKADTDVYIKPNISGYSVVSFEQGKEIIKRGVEAAKKEIVKLDSLKKNESIANEFERSVPKFTDSLHIGAIQVVGLEDYTRRYVYGKLGFVPGQSITYQDLGQGIDRLNGTQNFSAISYKFEADGDKDIFKLNVIENPIKRYLKLGLHYDGLYKSAALVNVTQKKLLFKSDVASLDVGLGDNLRFNLNYYVDNGFYWSVGFNSKFNQFNKTLQMPEDNFLDGFSKNINVDYKKLSNRLFFQTYYAQKILLGVGIEHSFLDVGSKTYSADISKFDKSHYLSGFANLRFDTYDNKYFPRSGFVFKGEFNHYFYSSDYTETFENFSIVRGELGYAYPVMKNLTLDLRSRVGMTIGTEPNPLFNFYMGGYGFEESDNILSFYGYDAMGIFDNSFISGRIQLDYEIIKKHHINIAANYANVGRSLFESMDWFSKPEYNGYALGYGFQTLIGPIEVKHSWSPDTKNHYTWFAIGFWF